MKLYIDSGRPSIGANSMDLRKIRAWMASSSFRKISGGDFPDNLGESKTWGTRSNAHSKWPRVLDSPRSSGKSPPENFRNDDDATHGRILRISIELAQIKGLLESI